MGEHRIRRLRGRVSSRLSASGNAGVRRRAACNRLSPANSSWVDRDGNCSHRCPPRAVWAPRLSPDGTKVVMFSGAAVSADGDGSGSTTSPVEHSHRSTTQQERVAWGLWSPDGSSQSSFRRVSPGRDALTRRSADGTGSGRADRRSEAPPKHRVRGQGRQDCLRGDTPGTRSDIWVLDVPLERSSDASRADASERYPGVFARWEVAGVHLWTCPAARSVRSALSGTRSARAGLDRRRTRRRPGERMVGELFYTTPRQGARACA